ncbi:MAG: F0F1 ATP synthase subunit gamma [Bacteroidota bacterium]|nr:F0F1 ATP synthase subunit gamma [Bacteroidota bacterium]
MSDTLESLQRRKQSAGELASVVRTMKAMAASNINQYEMAVKSLQDYYRTISLGINACFRNKRLLISPSGKIEKNKILTVAIVFGSDQGLVGTFNDILSTFVQQTLQNIPGKKETWAVGERVYSRLEDAGLSPNKLFNVPNSVTAITPLVNDILLNSEEYRESNQLYSLYIFHNSPLKGEGYQQESQRLFPLDKKWEQEITKLQWPAKNLPQVIGGTESALHALIKEYLFVSIYKACAESLASENASRLAAMERAEQNIDDILDDLKQNYNRIRQSTIDEELFDVIAGFEALKDRQ